MIWELGEVGWSSTPSKNSEDHDTFHVHVQAVGVPLLEDYGPENTMIIAVEVSRNVTDIQ